MRTPIPWCFTWSNLSCTSSHLRPTVWTPAEMHEKLLYQIYTSKSSLFLAAKNTHRDFLLRLHANKSLHSEVQQRFVPCQVSYVRRPRFFKVQDEKYATFCQPEQRDKCHFDKQTQKTARRPLCPLVCRLTICCLIRSQIHKGGEDVQSEAPFQENTFSPQSECSSPPAAAAASTWLSTSLAEPRRHNI